MALVVKRSSCPDRSSLSHTVRTLSNETAFQLLLSHKFDDNSVAQVVFTPTSMVVPKEAPECIKK